jgi:hypothetical protein
LQFRQQQAEERGAEQHAGDHLAHHLRLAHALRQPPDQPADRDDDRGLQEEIHGKLGRGHGVDAGGWLGEPETKSPPGDFRDAGLSAPRHRKVCNPLATVA